MGKKNELGGYYVYIPDSTKLNVENKELLPPETKYEKRRSRINEKITKKLCGGKYGKGNNEG